jgi:hypothetical protein
MSKVWRASEELFCGADHGGPSSFELSHFNDIRPSEDVSNIIDVRISVVFAKENGAGFKKSGLEPLRAMLCNYAEAIGLGSDSQAMDEDISPSFPKCSLYCERSEAKDHCVRQPRLFDQFNQEI